MLIPDSSHIKYIRIKGIYLLQVQFKKMKTSMNPSCSPALNLSSPCCRHLFAMTVLVMFFMCACKKEYDYRDAFTGEYQTLKKGRLAPWGWGQDVEEEVILVVLKSAIDSTIYIEEKPRIYVGSIKITEEGDFGKKADGACAENPIYSYSKFCGYIRNDSLYIDCFLTLTGNLEYSGIKIK